MKALPPLEVRIRKFREEQERKKREEEEAKEREKIQTLQHRAAQGDRKAKIQIKKIEKVKEESSKFPEPQPRQQSFSRAVHAPSEKQPATSKTAPKPKPKCDPTDFDELMKLANQNAKEIRKPPPPPPSELPPPSGIKTVKSKPAHLRPTITEVTTKRGIDRIRTSKPVPPPSASLPKSLPSSSNNKLLAQQQQQLRERELKVQQMNAQSKKVQMQLEAQKKELRAQEIKLRQMKAQQLLMKQQAAHSSRPAYVYSNYRHQDDEDDYDEEDEYEQDDFVVDEDDDDVQDEVSRTIRSVFKYDKRRCDDRERELDREYRAIGRVSTFEDLEREERRASKLAAAEDKKALMEEEERKRLKKLRLKKS